MNTNPPPSPNLPTADLTQVANEAAQLMLSEFNQDANAALELEPQSSRLRGLIRIVDGSKEWLSFHVNSRDVQDRGVRAVALDFIAALRNARDSSNAA